MENREETLAKGLRNVRLKASMHEKKEGMKIMLFATFYGGGKKLETIADKVSYDKFGTLVKNYLKLQSREVDAIRVDFYDTRDLNKPFDSRTIDLKNTLPELVKEITESQFRGLGEAEVDAMVERKWKEKEKEQQFFDMKERLKDQTQELTEAEKTIDALTKMVTNLTEQLESKTTLRYYAGMVGDFLEGLGLPKAKISEKLSGLLGMEEEKEKKAIPQKSTDNSGIVEENTESPDDKKRRESIDLMRDFLTDQSNQTLQEIYEILSEVELDKSLPAKIINYLHHLKTKNNDDPPIHSEDRISLN